MRVHIRPTRQHVARCRPTPRNRRTYVPAIGPGMASGIGGSCGANTSAAYTTHPPTMVITEVMSTMSWSGQAK